MSDLFAQHAPLEAGVPQVYLRVAVERGLSRRAGDEDRWAETLTYRVPADGPVPEIGQRVEIPLGRGHELESGYVVARGGAEILGDLPAHKIKPIARASAQRLPEPLVELARWMAEYYVCPLGMVMAIMMPAAVKTGTGTVTRTLLEPVPAAEASPILASSALKPAARHAWDAIVAQGLTGAHEPRALATALGLKTIGPLNRLVEAGLLRRVERQTVRSRAALYHTISAAPAPAPTITRDQRRVVDGVTATLGSFHVHLLRGVTGSGKTEVYMHAIAAALERNEQSLVLVPEIALTPQTASRFLDRFAASDPPGSPSVAVLHSGLSAGERHRQWMLAASDRCRVVVGARSAVFAPLPRLGLIVVDEEHASDYKQDQLPRYHGRDVAIKRAQLQKCPILLGSATPSLESWSNAQGPAARFRLWELNDRVGGGTLPNVEIIDLVQERFSARAGHAADAGSSPSRSPAPALGPTLRAALLSTLCDHGQAILLLNRRGFASHICCPSQTCGWVMTCDHCDAAMVLHKTGTRAGQLVRCHHCLAEQTVPRVCAACGKTAIQLGVGTQRVEEELTEILRGWPDLGMDPAAALCRVDGDTMRSGRDYFDVLARFGRGEIKILLGTQMIAKGLDFPGVRLVGVINADIGLSLPDFRSSERVFQLISQVAGRAGRGTLPGRVIVQTVNSRDPAIMLAAAHDYVSFARRELEIRRRSALPPATRLARIVVRDENALDADARASEIARLLRASAGRGCTVVGPGPAPVSRIANHFRVAVELFAPTAGELHRALRSLADHGQLKSDAHTAVDVDPVALM